MEIERDNLGRIAVTALAETMGVPVAAIRVGLEIGIGAYEDMGKEFPVQRRLRRGRRLSAARFGEENAIYHIDMKYT